MQVILLDKVVNLGNLGRRKHKVKCLSIFLYLFGIPRSYQGRYYRRLLNRPVNHQLR